jgi:Zn-dependent protease
MFASWRIARILDIDLYIHWTFWLLPVWVLFNRGESNLFPLWLEMLLIGCLFVCVVLHEFGHALAARDFGIRTRSITLSPLGGLAQLERMSHKPWEEFCIAVAGPLVNVAIAFVLGVGLLAAGALGAPILDSLAGRFVGVLLLMNVSLVVFNMLPAFPMDGGRVLRAILAGSMGLLQGTRVAVIVGTITAVLIGLVGLFWNPVLVFIAAFVIWAGHQELRALEMEEREKQNALRRPIFMWDSGVGQWVRHVKHDSGVGF